MATKEFYLSGICKWAKVLPDNGDAKFERWTIDLFMDDKSWGKFDDSGLQLKVREDDEGDKFVKFARRFTDWEGNKVDAPEIHGADGEIGNGSEVTIKVEVFDTKNGKGHRLLAVRVDELQEYESRQVDEDIDVPF